MSLGMIRVQRSEFVILLLNIVGFSVTVLNRLWFTAGEISLHNWQTVHGLLIMHITLANLGFAALTVAAVFAMLYLFLHRKLKNKNGMIRCGGCRVLKSLANTWMAQH